LTDHAIDLAAASRISRRVDLREIRLTQIKATFQNEAMEGVVRLSPSFDHDCVPIKVGADFIEVACSYTFKVHSVDLEVATADMTYYILYKLLGDEPTEQSDVEHFARANGAYHSWPFVRETIYSLTAKMGFPPYTLPVLSFLPRPNPSVLTVQSSSVSPPMEESKAETKSE
jgi:hypothetical protein